MAVPNKITGVWVSSMVVSRLKKEVDAYHPTGLEKDKTMRTLFYSIDAKAWSATLENFEGKDWIAIPIQSPSFENLDDNSQQVVPLRISFFRTKEYPHEFLFQVDAYTVRFEFVEQGVRILNHFNAALNEVRGIICKEKVKRKKLRNLIESSIDDTIQDLLKGTIGLSYNVTFLQSCFELRLLLPYNREVLFTIPYEKFAEHSNKIPQQLEYICMCMSLSIQGFPFTFGKAKSSVKWTPII